MSDVQYPSSADAQPLPASGDVPPAGTVEETPAPPASAPALTLEQVQAAIADAMARNRTETTRALQSQLDKRDSNLLKQINALRQQSKQIADVAQSSGIDEAQAKQLSTAFFNSSMDTLLNEQAAEPVKPGAPQATHPGDGSAEPPPIDDQQLVAYQQYVTQTGDRLREAWSLEYSDPEMKTLVTDRDEQAYYDSIKAAGKAKRERLTRESRVGQPARQPGLGPDGGSAPRNPLQGVENTGDLYKMAADQERAARQRG